MKNKSVLLLLLLVPLLLFVSCDSNPANVLDELLDTQANMIIESGSIDCSFEDAYLTVELEYSLSNTADEKIEEIVLKNPEYKESTVEYINVFFDSGNVVEISGVDGEARTEKIALPKVLEPGEGMDIKIEYGVSGFEPPNGNKKTWRWVVPYLDATALTEKFKGMPIKITLEESVELISSVPLGFVKEGNSYTNNLTGLINMVILDVN